MSLRRGACPALSAPMQTGDGLLVRLATAGASLSPQQLVALCGAAERHGNGLVEITARGNFQIRGLTPDSATALATDIAAMKLGLRDGVPVETNPLAGLDPTEIANPAPLASAIRDAIDATDLKDHLAPKVTVVVDGGGRIGLRNVAADIRFDALGQAEWLVSIGGDASTAQALGRCAGKDATTVTCRLLERIAETGSDARGRNVVTEAAHDALGRLVGPLQAPAPRRMPARPFGNIPLAGIRFAFGVGLPFGQITAGELSTFVKAVEANGADEFRMSPGRALLVLRTGCRDAIADIANAARLVTNANDPRARIFACPGSDGCASGYIPARQIAASVADELAGNAADFSLHISGCPKGCAHPAPASLTLVGKEEGPILVQNGSARGTGIPFGNHNVAVRLADALRIRSSTNDQPEVRRKPHPAHAFAGD